MKRKITLRCLFFIVVLTLCLSLCACGKKDEGEVHTHNLEHHEVVSATCVEDGTIEYWSCSTCDKIYSDDKAEKEITETKIAALGHDFETEFTIDKAATCITEGSESKHCTRCNEKSEITKIDNTNVHTYKNGVCEFCNDECGHTFEFEDSFEQKYLKIVNDEENPFTIADGVITSTNHDHNSSSKISFIALYDVVVSFGISTDIDQGDRCYIYINNNEFRITSNSYRLDAGDILTIEYRKDKIISSPQDYIKLIAFKVTGYSDSYNCHDRLCQICDSGLIEASIDHNIDEYACSDDFCDICGEFIKATEEHALVDMHECHDRKCNECGQYVMSSKAHEFGVFDECQMCGEECCHSSSIGELGKGVVYCENDPLYPFFAKYFFDEYFIRSIYRKNAFTSTYTIKALQNAEISFEYRFECSSVVENCYFYIMKNNEEILKTTGLYDNEEIVVPMEKDDILKFVFVIGKSICIGSYYLDIISLKVNGLSDDIDCHERNCSICGNSVAASYAHTIEDIHTCHDRHCIYCDKIYPSTTAHTLSDEYTCHDRICSTCGDVVYEATTDHTLPDEHTCHDRICSICGETVKNTTEHDYNVEGVCEICGESCEHTLDIDNCQSIISIENDEKYPFLIKDGRITSTNHDDSSISKLTITALRDVFISFSLNCSSEEECDKIIIAYNDGKFAFSGTYYVDKYFHIELKEGEKMTIEYSKDFSDSSGYDCGYIADIVIRGCVTENTCEDQTCSICGKEIAHTTTHYFEKDYECHDRECSICGETVKKTIEHNYINGVCEICGESCEHKHIFDIEKDKEIISFENDEDNPFLIEDGRFTSTNHNDSSTSILTFTALCDVEISFTFGASSEEEYDNIYVLLNGEVIYFACGDEEGYGFRELKKNDILQIAYRKDEFYFEGGDFGYFEDFIITYVEGNTCLDCGKEIKST